MINISLITLLIGLITFLLIAAILIDIVFFGIIYLFKKNKKEFAKKYLKYLEVDFLILIIGIILMIIGFLGLIHLWTGMYLFTLIAGIINYYFARIRFEYNKEVSFIFGVYPEIYYRIIGIVTAIIGLIGFLISLFNHTL